MQNNVYIEIYNIILCVTETIYEMGALLATRQHDGIEEIDIGPNHVYRYPPRSGVLVVYYCVNTFKYFLLLF